MCEIKEVCVENMKKIRENFIENYPFVYVDDAIEMVKNQEHEFLCGVDYSQPDVKATVSSFWDIKDEIILSMVNYNDRGKYKGKTFVEVSDYATNRALQTDRLRAFGLIKSEAAISIFEECIGVIRQCRVHAFTESDIKRVARSFNMLKEMLG